MDLSQTLKKHFGYDRFRPLQEDIVRDALTGRDVFVLMPTGAGKSLCFQLPALMRSGLTIVVSPLISLMKDQVDALQASGIPATFLNSALERREASERLRKLNRNGYRLLYVAPERLMLDTFLERALNWDIAQIAIDEAHCISEWGHDFRPEYRELKKLRSHFPDVPVMALTATATERVRADIVKQLKLKDPRCYVGSFNRENLNYRVIAKVKPYEQLLEFVRQRSDEAGIVYCASRKTADSVAAKLDKDGIAARPYHAGLPPAERARHQELFLRDDVRVIAATIAFGMGINKPNVRYVVHYDLPKNVEGYYQETGRAGRDGLPGQCVLLFSGADVVKQSRFIEEKSDKEAVIAREQLRQMLHYAETRQCRRRVLLQYFGEELAQDTCGNCDNCLTPRETFDGTTQAQKLLSCVYRLHEKHGFGFGLNHVADVLCGGDTETIRRHHHERLSTFGIGRDIKKTTWQAMGRELLRLGLVEAAAGKFATLQLTESGLAALRKRKTIMLTTPFNAAGARQKPASRKGDIHCDEKLFAQLRAVRRQLADERDVPAYIIFSDATLRQMAHACPTTKTEFATIPGVGQQKLRDFAEPFTRAIAEYLGSNPDTPRLSRTSEPA